MQERFDEVLDRRGTCSLKWDAMGQFFGGIEDALPLWVADMDFATPSPVVEAMRRRLDHPVFGYAARPRAFFDAVAGWVSRRYGWSVPGEWIVAVPGVVPATACAVLAHTEPGDGVLIQPPVYFPFRTTIETLGRKVVENPLRIRDGRYAMDYGDLEEKAGSVKLAILCSPHNPVGRVWTKDELRGFGRLLMRRGALVLSDEIHADIVFPPNRFVSYGTLGRDFADRALVCHAPSKTFNMAGIKTATTIIPSRKLRARYQEMLMALGLHGTSSFGIPALMAAYGECEEWLEDLLVYLRGNYEFLGSWLSANEPRIRLHPMEGTYLAWLDCAGLGLSDACLKRFLLDEAKLALDEGPLFGTGGEGFVRINLACPRVILEHALDRLGRALEAGRSRGTGEGAGGSSGIRESDTR
ncbi:pyridoxal phosphate-dependent aminotransferase [Candidatus Fermentibacteria bacterium]|nr:pyridoxal phosphate-dependent aminotransferase [Candidatus Fermentibacteria bacterium]